MLGSAPLLVTLRSFAFLGAKFLQNVGRIRWNNKILACVASEARVCASIDLRHDLTCIWTCGRCGSFCARQDWYLQVLSFCSVTCLSTTPAFRVLCVVHSFLRLLEVAIARDEVHLFHIYMRLIFDICCGLCRSMAGGTINRFVKSNSRLVS